MKKLFIPAKIASDVNADAILKLSNKLPKNIAIAYSIQFKDIAEKIKQILFNSKKHKITLFTQVLGCSNPKFPKTTNAVLLITSGQFHAISLAISAHESKLPIYILYKNQLKKLSNKELIPLIQKQKASYMKFLNADKVGILVSTKPGQNRLKKSLELQNKLKSSKKPYVFLSNAININEFENFPDIDSWINTACPRMDMDSSIININNLNLSN